MTDERLRQARRSATDGDVESRARHILERLRATATCEGCDAVQGRIGEWMPCISCRYPNDAAYRTRVYLACYCNDLAARIAVFGTNNPNAEDIPPGLAWLACGPFDGIETALDSFSHRYVSRARFDFHGWAMRLQRWGPTTLLRASIPVARRALDVWELGQLEANVSLGTRDGQQVHPQVLNDLGRERLLRKIGCIAPRLAVVEAEAALVAVERGDVLTVGGAQSWRRAWDTALEVMARRALARHGTYLGRAGAWLPDPRLLDSPHNDAGDWPGPVTCGSSVLRGGPEEARGAIEAALVAWALAER